jgi:hypothetical protein
MCDHQKEHDGKVVKLQDDILSIRLVQLHQMVSMTVHQEDMQLDHYMKVFLFFF